MPPVTAAEAQGLQTLFADPYWALYHVGAPTVDGEVYLRLGGPWDPADPRLI